MLNKKAISGILSTIMAACISGCRWGRYLESAFSSPVDLNGIIFPNDTSVPDVTLHQYYLHHGPWEYIG